MLSLRQTSSGLVLTVYLIEVPLIVDDFLYSHYLSVLYCINNVIKLYILITLGN